jgi:carbamoyl-phosphate synthase/aspartate carbamoyltransferase
MKLITKHFTVEGTSFGAEVPAHGELVFSTAMVGYPQALTDPSFYGQILVLTFPLVGNYGVPLDCDKNSNHLNLDNLETHLNSTFESNKIHIAGLVVQSYADDFSHFTAKKSLGDWLKEHGIPAIFGVDTRMLTKKIRNSGDIHCQLLPDGVKPLAFVNQPNLVKLVSRKDKIVLQPKTFTLTQDGKRINILAIDVGMKYNQIRCFLNRGVILTIVPWDYDFLKEDFDGNINLIKLGLFISNGPGDPSTLTETIARIKKQLELKTKPVFGICLGHQLMALASGATTEKMPFGNRGINIPVTCQFSGKCYITSQNHGYAVKSSTIQKGWKELFRNANDDSNEGLISEELPYVSVQFHPESRPGPWDTEFLFDDFISLVKGH